MTDIIEMLNTAWVADALEAGHIRSTIVAERMIRERHAALAEITDLRAERDATARERYRLIADLADMKARAMRGEAAARDMRERAAHEAEGYFSGVESAEAIRALPLIATSEKDAT